MAPTSKGHAGSTTRLLAPKYLLSASSFFFRSRPHRGRLQQDGPRSGPYKAAVESRLEEKPRWLSASFSCITGREKGIDSFLPSCLPSPRLSTPAPPRQASLKRADDAGLCRRFTRERTSSTSAPAVVARLAGLDLRLPQRRWKLIDVLGPSIPESTSLAASQPGPGGDAIRSSPARCPCHRRTVTGFTCKPVSFLG
jgi:hypothetical protein